MSTAPLNDRLADLAREHTTLAGALGVIVVAVAYSSTGLLGALTGIVLIGIWMVSPPIVVFFLGQTLVIVFWPDSPLSSLWLVETGLFAILAGSLTAGRTPLVSLGSYVIITGFLLGITGYTYQTTGSLLKPTGVLIITTGLSAYAFHRYELVTLDLIPDQ